MTRGEFLNKLKHDLSNDLNSTQVQENVDYYDKYIKEEVDKGRSESEVVDELGDPWAIAKNIVLGQSLSQKSQNSSDKKSAGKAYEGNPDKGSSRSHSFSLDTRWKRILAVVAVVVVVLIVLSLFSAIFRILSPVLIVVMVVLMLARIIQQRRH